MLGFILALAVTGSVQAAITWSDCAADPSNTAMTVNEFDFHPNPVVFPGELHVTLNLTVNKPIDLVFLDVELVQKTVGGDVRIPCIGDTNIGSCKNIDACNLLPKINSGGSVVSSDLGLQIDKILLLALGHNASCPINPENVLLNNAHLRLNEVPSTLLSTIANGDYELTLKIKDDPTTDDNIGCFTFAASLQTKQTGGLLFG